MPVILSPRPRPATRILRPNTAAAIAMPHELPYSKIPPRAPIELATPRLMSPIELAPSAMAPTPRSGCTPVPRRRSKPYPTPHHHRRLLSRPACNPEPPKHTFDQLPWIAALDATPDHLDIWDIADLSQLPGPPRPSCNVSASGPRRRRKSLRRNAILNPLPLSSSCSERRPSTPLCDTSINLPADTSRPQTPRPRFNPSRVLFHHLMPVLCDSHNDESNHCTFMPALPLNLC